MPFNKNRNETKREYKPLPEGKMRRYVHDPFTLEHQGTKVSVSDDGKVTIKQIDPDHSDEYDEVEVSASLIIKLNHMLEVTRKVHIVDKVPSLK